MELHVIEREGRETVVLLDNEMRIVKPVYDYLKFQRQKDKALNTLKASGSDLRTYWEFLNDSGYEYDKVTPKMIAEFIDYLRASDACYALISWNDEYMQQALIATNLTKEQAQITMKEHTLARLVELDIVETVEMAATMYDAAANCTPDTEIDALHVGSDEASISFGSDHEERISIVMQPSITHD